VGAELLKLEPKLDLLLLESEHQSAVEQIQDVDRQWSEVSKAQNWGLDIRTQKVMASNLFWQEYLNSQVATQPASRRAKRNPSRQRLLCKVYKRPGLPTGLRTVHGQSHSHRY